jgi:hypothetical protein
MKLHRLLVASSYGVLILMFVTPFAETFLSILPIRTNEVNWRFGVFGLFSRALMTPLLALAGMCGLAFVRGHRGTLRFLGGTAALLLVILVLSLGMFALDAVQARAQVTPQALSSFDVAATLAVGKILFSTVILALMAIGAWKSAGRPAQRSRADTVLLGATPKQPAAQPPRQSTNPLTP